MSTTLQRLYRQCGWLAVVLLAVCAGQIHSAHASDALQSDPALSGATNLMETAGDWLLAQRLPDGSFPWTTGGSSFPSVQAQPGLALIEAWRVTGRQDFRDAAVVAADDLVAGGFAVFPGAGGNAPHLRSADPLFFSHLSQATGDPVYRDFIQTHFWDRLAAGLYGPDGDWDIDAYVLAELDRRLVGGQPVLAAWDLIQVAAAAQIAGRGDATMQALLDGAVTALEAAPGQYDIVGLSWSVAGGTVFNHEMDPQAGLWAGSGGTAGLAGILAGYPESNGGFVYLTASLGNINQTSAQSTAFALFGLSTFDLAGHYDLIRDGLAFIENKQAASGQIVDINNPAVAGNVLGHADAMRVYGMILNEFRSDLSLTKIATPSVPAPDIGDSIDYQITVLNSGNTPLTDVGVSDDLIGLDCVPAIPVASLAGGDAITCTGSYTVTGADLDLGDPIINQASAVGTSVNAKQLTADDQTSTALAAAAPAISLAKSITAGDPYAAIGDVIDYAFQVDNSGNVTLEAIALDDDLIGPVTCPAATLAAGASMTCLASYTVLGQDIGNGSVTNTAQVQATPVRGLPSPVTASDQATATWSLAAMTLTKSAAPSTPMPAAGDTIDYQILVENTGSQTLSQVQVVDPLISLDCTPALPVASLAAGASITCTGTYTVAQADIDDGVPVVNIATASASDPGGAQLTAQDSTSTALVAGQPALSLDKTITGGDPYTHVGDVIDYSYLVGNPGTVTVQAISLTDDRIGTITCPASQLAPATSMTCTASDTVQPADLTAGTITNIAQASGLTTAGVAVAASSSAVAYYAGPPPGPVSAQPVPGPGRLALAVLVGLMLLLGGRSRQRRVDG
ncbi:MAG: hypothetical protein M0Q42_06625 [Xanthomonadales bacterium]|nr:hypothetical protein [Xanthomonadales bacterium]